MKDTILSIIRHGLTFGGSLAATHGYLSDSTAQSISGGVVAFVALVWGALDEFLAARKAKAAAK